MSKILSHLPALTNILKRIAQEAGEITLDHFVEGMALPADIKGDGTPVTIADRAAEEKVIERLSENFPGIPVVGEESVSSGAAYDLSEAEYFFLVDPLDGTREFAAGGKDYTVNIALIKNGEPVAGVIYAPALGELYSGHGEGTAKRWLEDTDNEKDILVRKPQRSGLIVLASKNRGGEYLEKFLEEHKVEKILRRGSSIKICEIARGKGDIYPNFGPTFEWDTAAGHAILKSAGGDIVDMHTGEPLRYGGCTAQFRNPRFIARTNYLA